MVVVTAVESPANVATSRSDRECTNIVQSGVDGKTEENAFS